VRVLHFYKTYLPDSYGGVEQFTYQLANGCVRRGLKVEVLSLSPKVGDETRQFGNHISHRVRRDFKLASTDVSIRSFARFAALARDADIVHYHHPWPFADLVHFATSISKPTVLTYHSDIVRQKRLLKLYRPLMNRFLGSVDRIVATSQNYLKTSSTLVAFPEKTSVIPIGLDRQSYPTPDVKLVARWRSEVGGRFLLFVGALRYYKGLHILIDANRVADHPLVIVGAGPIEDELRKHAQRVGLTNTRFLGALPDADKVALYNLCYAVVFPSHMRSEAFGISLLEGAMFGKPMISSEIGTGTSYVNSHEETGLVVPPNDPHSLSEAMCFLYDNPSRAEEMGRRAFLRYQRYFTADQMVESYIALYQDLLASARS
jgi:glycosyltransferase involved in cell wall biosynthesis